MTDDELMASLGAALRRHPEPLDDPAPNLVSSAHHAFGFRNIDDELALLIFDSLTDAVAMRSASGGRSLSFRMADVTIDIDVVADGDDRRLHGTVTPVTRTELWLESNDQRFELDVDERGRFAVVSSAGAARLRVTNAAGRSSVTSWVTL